MTRAALHHNDLFNSRRPVGEVLTDATTPDFTRIGLETVGRVMAYAAEHGLHTEGAYGYLIQSDSPHVSYLVQAAEVDRLKSVTWWFPIVGRVPYLGYFNRDERDDKAAELRGKGYDVSTGAAGAFSSLGWFDDPIFNSMLSRREGDLAHLFFHELTHRTIWIPGSVRFNENLAEYVAGILTFSYLTRQGKLDEIARYEGKKSDRALFRDWLKRLRAELELLYKNDEKRDRSSLLAAKQAVFRRYQSPPLKPAFQVVDYVKGEEWNNASVLGASLYAPDTDRFAKAHACTGDVRLVEFFALIEEAVQQREDDAFAALDGLCSRASASLY